MDFPEIFALCFGLYVMLVLWGVPLYGMWEERKEKLQNK